MQRNKSKTRRRQHFLPEWCESFGFSPGDLIKATEADKSVVSRWLGERRSEPTPEYLDKLGKLFGVSPDRLYSLPPEVHELQRVPDADDVWPTPHGDDDGAAFVDGRVVYRGIVPGSTPETTAAGGMGYGKLDGAVARVQTHGIATGHPVAAEWVIPPSFLRHSLGGQPETTIIVPVIGHSMEPRLYEGDRVIVDVSQSNWVADAIYAIAFGDENFQVKTIKMDRKSKPPVYRIISEATPGDEERLLAEDFRIVGRVVGRISRP
ncbi:LexA family transcriptional regulator [uncultured Devosia sp.]|uniref:LexA family transcriptional regulator n=1 Tax=uncultured Devosia sp. TaxID=211434 RepID=UPI00261EF58A|nr:LexA family transcriptional regulator [uncultured Devosia sp.]